MGQYEVFVVEECELPGAVDWMFTWSEERLNFWLKRSVMTSSTRLERALGVAWSAYREIRADDALSWPELASIG